MKIVDINKIINFIKNNEYREAIPTVELIKSLEESWASPWQSGDVIPAEEDRENGIIAVVNGPGGHNLFFEDAVVVCDYNEREGWYSEDYDISDCKIKCWMPIPEFDDIPKNETRKEDIVNDLEHLLEDFSEEGRSSACDTLKAAIDILREKGGVV